MASVGIWEVPWVPQRGTGVPFLWKCAARARSCRLLEACSALRHLSLFCLLSTLLSLGCVSLPSL